MEKNRRVCPRVEVRFPVDYKYYEKGWIFHALKSEAVNISAGGMAMRSDRPIQIGRKVLVTLELPPECQRSDPHQRLQSVKNEPPVMIFSEVVRCESHDNGAYIAGLKFLAPEIHHRERFTQFLNNYRIFWPMSYADAPDPEYGES